MRHGRGGRRGKRGTGPRNPRPAPFRSYYTSSDDLVPTGRAEWSASEHAIDKWIKRFGDPEMTRTEAQAQLIAAAETASQEREKGRDGALFYRCDAPSCRLIVRHQATGKRILTVLEREDEVGGEEGQFEVDDAA